MTNELFANNFVPIIGCLMMFAFVIKNHKLPRRKRNFFAATLIIFLLGLFFRNADNIVSNYEHFTIRRQIYSAFGYTFRAFLIYALLGTDFNLKNKKVQVMYAYLGIPLIITVVSAFSVFFTDKVYYFEKDTNSFCSGPLSWLNYAALVFYLIMIVGIAVWDFIHKKMQHGYMITGTGILMIAAILSEYFYIRDFLCESIITMALMLYLFFFQNDEFENKSKELKQEALIDGLTGLYNRSGYNELFNRLSREDDLLVAILMIDVDSFKAINDTYGHDVGDIILKKVANLLKVTFRSSDFVIRYGGDEFMVIMLGITDKLTFVVKNKIESINVDLENPISNIPKTSISSGIAFSENGISEELFKQADEALYKTKNTTRRGCTAYSELTGGQE